MNYLLLFTSAFLAGSLFPAQSEVVFLALLQQNQSSILLLLFFASSGNILGSCLNWYLGKHLLYFQNRKWFPFTQAQIQKAQHHYNRYGYLSLLLSWLPIIGDPLTLIAGILKENFWRFLILVSIAKVGRYLMLYFVFIQF